MFLLTFVLCSTLIIGESATGEDNNCEFQPNIRTYFCREIFDVFPNVFYGNYHLQCVKCNIRTFSNKTFNFTNSLLTFNASASGIRYVTTRALSSLSNAQYIDLSHNEILEISPGAFFGLRQVYELHLQYNFITNIYPGVFEELQANSIDVSNNKIKELPNGAFEGSLSILTLDMSNNHIKKLYEDSFLGLDILEVLNLSNNKICHLPLGVFKDLSTLRTLDLSDNQLSRFALGSFSGPKNLHTLKIANNSLSIFDANILLPFNHLARLDISGNGIYYFDANAVHINVPTLKMIRLDDNLFSCTVLMNVIQYFKKVNVEVVNTMGRYRVQNVNGIACTDVAITEKVDFKAFLQVAQEEARKYVMYC